LAEGAVIIQRLVYDVPAVNFSTVPAHDRENMFVHAGEQRGAVNGIAVIVLKNPGGGLLVPDQVVADDGQVIGQAKIDVTIGEGEIELIALRMDASPFQDVFGRDTVELLSDEGRFDGIRPTKLGFIECGANEEIIFESVFQRRFGAGGRGQQTKQGGDLG